MLFPRLASISKHTVIKAVVTFQFCLIVGGSGIEYDGFNPEPLFGVESEFQDFAGPNVAIRRAPTAYDALEVDRTTEIPSGSDYFVAEVLRWPS